MLNLLCSPSFKTAQLAISFRDCIWFPMNCLFHSDNVKLFGEMWNRHYAMDYSGIANCTLIMWWYPNFLGSHFGLPHSSIHKMTGREAKWCERWRMRTGPHSLKQKKQMACFVLYAWGYHLMETYWKWIFVNPSFDACSAVMSYGPLVTMIVSFQFRLSCIFFW